MRVDCLETLQTSINENMSLEEIISAFEKMCETPIADDMVLFETGTFDFTGEDLFYFSLTRQFPSDDDEYYQIHVDVLYKPDNINQGFRETVWNTEIEDKIFDYVRQSKEFEYACSKAYVRIVIYMGET